MALSESSRLLVRVERRSRPNARDDGVCDSCLKPLAVKLLPSRVGWQLEWSDFLGVSLKRVHAVLHCLHQGPGNVATREPRSCRAPEELHEACECLVGSRG